MNNYVPGQLDYSKETIGGTTDASGTIIQKFPHTTKNQQQRGSINYGGATQARLKHAMARPNQMQSAQTRVKSAHQLKTYTQPTGFQVTQMNTVSYDKSSNF